MNNLHNYKSIEIHSSQCVENSIFLVTSDNEKYIVNAIENGASLIITNKEIKCNCEILISNNINEIFSELLDFFYPNNLKIIGVTGTDGKTSTALMIKSLIDQNSSCGYIGTNGIIYNDTMLNTINTTPDIITIRKTLYNMSKENVEYVTIECSSEGIVSNRLFSLKFDTLIYTNITHEHLNTHKTMKNYIDIKLSLLNKLKTNGYVFVNNDDKNLKNIENEKMLTYGFKKADIKVISMSRTLTSTTFKYIYNNSKNIVTIPFFGKYNIYNCLASILVLDQYNLFYKTNLMYIKPISGRFEMISKNNKNIIVDFAHTPNALENLLKNIKEITKKKIILIMGSAGGKDKTKRPMLGRIANKYADEIIITSEDPKHELITNIFSDIIKTIKKEYYLVLFRKDAIKMGIDLTTKDSILVIVGKGLENQEQIFNIKFNHNDYLYAKYLLDTYCIFSKSIC